MKVSCILTSFNRPRFVRQALKSVADQTHRDFELIVMDESTIFDIRTAVSDFSFPNVKVRHFDMTAKERRQQNRLSIKVNKAFSEATGDLVCYLADDDYYYPNWLENASTFFDKNPLVSVGFGKLVYSTSPEMVYPVGTQVRWFSERVHEPFANLDHNQVIHKRLAVPPVLKWREDMGALTNPDAHFFSSLAYFHPFLPIDAFAAVKRVHPKNLQATADQYLSGFDDGIME